MSETNQRQGRREAPGKPRRVLRCIGRTLLAILSVAAVLLAGLCMIMDEVFNGPSETARNRLTMSLLEASATKWVPAVFVGQETVDQIQAKVAADLPEGQSDPTQVVIRREGGLEDDEWAEHPDGLRVEEVHGDTYNAYVMLIRDPARVYLSHQADRDGGRSGGHQRRSLLRQWHHQPGGGQRALRPGGVPGGGAVERRQLLLRLCRLQ